MKPILFCLWVALSVACAGSDKGGDTNNTKQIDSEEKEAVEGTPQTACEEEIALECPDGQVDSCALTPATSTVHACVDQEATDDDEEAPPLDTPDESE